MFSTIQNLKDGIGDAFSRTTHYIDDNLSESSKRYLTRGIGDGLTLLGLGILLPNFGTLIDSNSEGVFSAMVVIAVLTPAIITEAIIIPNRNLNRNSLPSLSTHHGLFTQKESYKNAQATPSLSLLESKLAKLDQSVTEIKEDISKLKGYKL